MTSNKLILQVDRRTMGGAYLQGITEINANSLLVNELVVKIGTWTGTATDNLYDSETQKFTQGKLLAGETLWVDFQKQGTTITKSMLLIEREETQLAATEELDGVTVTEIPDEKQYEYYITLPQAILQNAGVWDFSLSIKHVSAINVANINQLQYMGEWNASTGAVQTVRTPVLGDFYHCTGVGYYNPDGTRNPTQYQLGEHAVYNGTSWVGSVDLFEFDYIKSSSTNTPYNMTVNNSLTMAGSNKPITEADVSAFLEMANMLEQGAQFNIPICCICAKTLDRAPSTNTTNNQTIAASLIRAGVPVVDQYALCTNGIVQINAIDETTGEISGTVKSAYRIKLNDTATSEQVFFAPTESGEDGQVLTANADAEPVWRSLRINNSAFLSDKTIYAPTGAGSNGNILASTGGTGTPVWRQLSINGSQITSNRNIYAPTTAGTSGYILKSNGSGAPSWVSPSTIGGGSSGNAYMFMLIAKDDANTLVGQINFTIFGNYTGYYIDTLEAVYNVVYNCVGTSIVPATGMWNDVDICGIRTNGDGYLHIIRQSGNYSSLYIYDEEADWFSINYTTASLSKSFNEAKNWSEGNEGEW